MLNIQNIKGIIFDYGATIDSNGKHWAEVLWEAYETTRIPVSKEAFREAYVFGERFLALNPVIQPHHTFKDVLLKKTEIQLNRLADLEFLPKDSEVLTSYSLAVSTICYNFVVSTLEKAIPVLEKLKEKYPLVLVSNFYGNVETVLKDFQLTHFFNHVVESAVVGVRKPDPAIFELGVKALKLNPEEVAVIGDSYDKDMVPSAKLGCRTIWLKGLGWEKDPADSTADIIIYDFKELKHIFQLN